MKQYLKPPSQNRFDCCCKALWWFLSTSLGWLSASAVADQESRDALPPLVKATVRSTLDEHEQPILYWAPARAKEQATPILILLHTWSGYFSQRHHDWQAEAVQRSWLYLQPNFRGPNNRPEALGSKLARRDVLDAIDFLKREFNVDSRRIFLAGVSGGGHMTMLMAGHHPEKFSAASAWVGISDVAQWYRFHTRNGKPDEYAQDILDSLGGPPGENDERDAEYQDRSPIHCLHCSTNLPVDIAAGIFDGHTGSVPVSHSVLAFNVIAKANGTPVVSDDEIAQLWEAGKTAVPQAIDHVEGQTFGREILLRRTSRLARLSIFRGGHEGLPEAACQWFDYQERQ
jgi:hypothetical protein